jgi:hypothetical protein
MMQAKLVRAECKAELEATFVDGSIMIMKEMRQHTFGRLFNDLASSLQEQDSTTCVLTVVLIDEVSRSGWTLPLHAKES